MNEPLASIAIQPNLKPLSPPVVVPEEPYYCPLCGVDYNLGQNQPCYCHPRLEQ